MKEGGIDVKEVDDGLRKTETKHEEDKDDPSLNNDPDEELKGFLMKSTIKM